VVRCVRSVADTSNEFSPETRAAMIHETGADFMLQGTVQFPVKDETRGSTCDSVPGPNLEMVNMTTTKERGKREDARALLKEFQSFTSNIRPL